MPNFNLRLRPGDAPAQPPMMPQQPQPQAWPPNPTAAVSIRGLFKRFDQKIAVNGLALDIPIGSFYGLVGPNGAGKTTTLNMVTGLLVPDAGTAMILGHDVWSDVNTAKRMIGVMPQPDQIFDRLTGLQLLIYSGMLRGMSREETTRRAKDLLNAFDLAQAANTMVTDYSAGMTKENLLGLRDDSQAHAFWCWMSRSSPWTRYLAPTSKTSWPNMRKPAARLSFPRM